MEVRETWLLRCLLLILLTIWLLLSSGKLELPRLTSLIKTQSCHEDIRLLLHLHAKHAECCLPVGRDLLARSVCSIVEVVIVVTSRRSSVILLDIVVQVVPRVLLLGPAA